MKEYPTYLTLKASRAMNDMTAHELYEILCDSVSSDTMGRIDYALNSYVGQSAEEDLAELNETAKLLAETAKQLAKQLGIDGKSALDDTAREELEVDEYAADNGLTEDEARRQLEEKAYWS